MNYKKVVINSAWPYAYNLPHLGNLIGSLLSGDVFSRYYKLKGTDTIFISGSDSHGTRIEFAALKKGITPKELAYSTHKNIKKAIKNFNIKFDNYTITDSNIHKKFVQEFYLRLEKKGFIFSKIEYQPYCENCKLFLADKFITGICPYCKSKKTKGNQCDDCGKIFEAKELIKPKCTLCSKEEVILKKTKHWYIDLEKLEPKLKKYLDSHKEWDKRVKEYTLNFFKMGLKPRPVTRDIKWGIPAPFKGAENKVFYVWVEAVLGYLSASKELLGNDYLKYWKEKNVKHIYCMGKDNVAFHTIVLPALLMADDKKWHLPDLISSIEFLNFNGKKFSKSDNNGIWVNEAIKILPAYYWRFYLLNNRPETADYNFTWEGFNESINNILIANLINFLNRTIKFSLKYGVKKCILNKTDKDMLKLIKKTYNLVNLEFEKGSLKNALNEIIKFGKICNKYFQDREPWKDEKNRFNTIKVSLELSKAITLLLSPFIPSVSEKVSKLLNFKIQNFSQLEKEFSFNHKLKDSKTIVEKIDIKKVKEKYFELKKSEKENESEEKMIKFEDFKKCDLRIGKITNVKIASEKLYKLTIEADKTRTIMSGLRKYYTIEELLNKKVVLIINLKPRKIMGTFSEGMVLAAEKGKKVVLITPDKDITKGAIIT